MSKSTEQNGFAERQNHTMSKRGVCCIQLDNPCSPFLNFGRKRRIVLSTCVIELWETFLNIQGLRGSRTFHTFIFLDVLLRLIFCETSARNFNPWPSNLFLSNTVKRKIITVYGTHISYVYHIVYQQLTDVSVSAET